MELLVLIIKHSELVDIINRNLAMVGIGGCTTINGTGMAKSLAEQTNMPFLGALKLALNDEEVDGCKIMFSVIDKSLIDEAKDTIRRVVGDLKKPNTGIMFTLPVNFAEGLSEK